MSNERFLDANYDFLLKLFLNVTEKDNSFIVHELVVVKNKCCLVIKNTSFIIKTISFKLLRRIVIAYKINLLENGYKHQQFTKSNRNRREKKEC